MASEGTGPEESQDEAGRLGTNERDSVHADGVPPDPAPGHTRDPRYETRRQNERRRRQRLQAEREEREAKEDLCLALVTSGMSYRAVGQRVNLSKSQVERLYKAGLERASNDTPQEFRQLIRFRLDRLLQAAWIPALAGDMAANRQALAVVDTQIRFEGQYPAESIDLNATFTVRRELTEGAIMRTLAEIQADRIVAARAGAIPAHVIESQRPALGNGQSPNGHDAH